MNLNIKLLILKTDKLNTWVINIGNSVIGNNSQKFYRLFYFSEKQEYPP